MRYLPDSHTDFVFAVGMDEPRIVSLGLVVLVLLAFLVTRRLRRP